MKNKLTIVFPTRPNIHNIKWLLGSLDAQTFQDFKVIWIIDSSLTQTEFDELKNQALQWLKNISDRVRFISNVNSDFTPQKWVSYVRNYGIKMADTEFTNLFDDDEILKPDYLQKSFEIYKNVLLHWKEVAEQSEDGGFLDLDDIKIPTPQLAKQASGSPFHKGHNI